MKRLYELSVLLLVLIVGDVVAGNPIAFQGVLYNEDVDSLLSDGSYSISFAFYESESGSSPSWQEDQMLEVRNGLYTAYLGSVSPLTSIDFRNPLWLEVTVEGQPLERVPFTATPFSYYANVATSSESIEGFTIDDLQRTVPFAYSEVDTFEVGTEYVALTYVSITVDRPSYLYCYGEVNDNNSSMWSAIQIGLYTTSGAALDWGSRSWRNPPAILNSVSTNIVFPVDPGTYAIWMDGVGATVETWSRISLNVMAFDRPADATLVVNPVREHISAIANPLLPLSSKNR